ncbi:putative E3 ubiquitin-protein ligase XERICO [Trifolium repens]|nr:putative E3 ubiquitin-protein ligase XERICO [Trifolium repens]
MESSCLTLSITPVFKPIQPISHGILSLNDCFSSIHLSYTHSIFSTTSNATNSLTNFRTNVNDHFLIPSEILCKCDTNAIMNADQNTLFLYNTFNFVPTHVLDTVLCRMGDCARQMIALNNGRCGILEMNVLLHVTSCNGNDDQQIENLLDKLKVGPSSSDSIDQCSICLEDYCEGSHSELIHTECSHIFHKDCITKWFHQCKDRSSSYSCPLCRREII